MQSNVTVNIVNFRFDQNPFDINVLELFMKTHCEYTTFTVHLHYFYCTFTKSVVVSWNGIQQGVDEGFKVKQD